MWECGSVTPFFHILSSCGAHPYIRDSPTEGCPNLGLKMGYTPHDGNGIGNEMKQIQHIHAEFDQMCWPFPCYSPDPRHLFLFLTMGFFVLASLLVWSLPETKDTELKTLSPVATNTRVKAGSCCRGNVGS